MISDKDKYLKRVRLIRELIEENYSLDDEIRLVDIREAVRIYEDQSYWVRTLYRQSGVLRDKFNCLWNIGMVQRKSKDVYIFINQIEESELEELLEDYYQERVIGGNKESRRMDNVMRKSWKSNLKGAHKENTPWE